MVRSTLANPQPGRAIKSFVHISHTVGIPYAAILAAPYTGPFMGPHDYQMANNEFVGRLELS